MRSMQDGRDSVQPNRNPASSALAHFATEGSDQRLNRGPANTRSGWPGKESIQRGLLRFVHGQGMVAHPFPDCNTMISYSAIRRQGRRSVQTP